MVPVIIDEAGNINQYLSMVGHAAMPVYLIDGDQPALIDAGVAAMGPLYSDMIRRLLQGRQPAYCLLTHSHFDHCGAAAILKTAFPQMQLVASQGAQRVFRRANALQLMRDLNRAAATTVAQFGIEVSHTAEFQPFDLDQTVQEGDTLTVSEHLTIQVLETPGHTHDCLSYFVPEASMLFASEAAGQITPAGYIVSDCLADYDQYCASLQRLSGLKAKYLCLGHLAVYTGADVPAYFAQSAAQCQQFHQLVQDSWQTCDGELAAVMNRVKAVEYDSYEGPKQTLQAYMINLEARIKAVIRSQQGL